LVANTPDTPTNKDLLLFTDGEKLLGQLQRADSNSVVFKSDMAGVLTIPWKNVQELRSGHQFVAVRKGTKLVWRGKYPSVPTGEIAANDANVKVEPAPQAPATTVPVTDIEALIPEADFSKTLNVRPNFFKQWTGAASLGISLVEATQTSETYTSSVNLTRLFPAENWVQPANRTAFTFSSTYGNLSQPGTPTVRTSIFHTTGERDEYFTPSVYVMGNIAFDHDYSQGLDLQQSYGAGLGWTAVKNANQTLDFKAELDYLSQHFHSSAQNQKLIGSIFTEGFSQKFKHATIQQQLTFNPAWTNLRAYSANAGLGILVPVFKRIGVTLSSTDTFLNDASPGFRKNSFQFTTALTYTVP
jgi:hypothetical protein